VRGGDAGLEVERRQRVATRRGGEVLEAARD
jgi:hypothetical protein